MLLILLQTIERYPPSADAAGSLSCHIVAQRL